MRAGGKIISIQFLRAIASLLVLQVHLFSYFPSFNRFFCGSIGVDIFFVISGYIIAESVVRLPQKQRAATFLINRFSRVAPYYYLLTIIAAALIFAFSGKLDLLRLEKSMLFLPDRRFDPILYLGWSLIHEMFFYLFVSLMIFAFPRIRTPAIAICFFCFISLCSFVPTPLYIVEFFGATINYTFLLGLSIFVFKNTVVPFFAGKVWLVASAILLFVTAIMSTDFPLVVTRDLTTDFYKRDHIYLYHSINYFPRILIWGVPSAFFFVTFLAHEKYFQKWQKSLMVLIGDASYSLYLVQGFLVLALAKITFLNQPYIKIVLAGLTVYTALKMFKIEAAVGNYWKKTLKQTFLQ